MPREVEIRLFPLVRIEEGALRDRAEEAYQIRQRYLAACGPRRCAQLKLTKKQGRFFLKISITKTKKKHQLLLQLPKDAAQRLQTEKAVLRIRRSKQILGSDVGSLRYSLTVKGSNDGLGRSEWENDIPAWAFVALWKDAKKRNKLSPIRKRRYYLREQGHLLQYDFFLRQLKGLTFIEVEFSKVKSAEEFRSIHGKKQKGSRHYQNFPLCVGAGAIEVTEKKNVGNRSLAKLRKRPHIFQLQATIAGDFQPFRE